MLQKGATHNFQSPSSSSATSTLATSSSSSSSQEATTSSSTSLYSDHRMQQSKQPSGPQCNPQESVGSSAKRYKNSPFGLKNHFLSMPDEEEEHETSSQHYCPEDLNSSNSDAAIYSDSPSGSPQRWSNYRSTHERHLSQPKSSRPLGELVAPAGDAGLDASKCNNKDLGMNVKRTQTLTDDRAGMKLKSQVESYGGEQASLLVKFSSIMYATFLVILGCILHISELRQKSKNSSDHIYTIVVALIGIIWLMFLQLDLLRYKRFASRYITMESIYQDQNQAMKRRASESRSTGSSSASLVNDRLSMDTEVVFKKTAYRMYQHQIAMSRNQSNIKRLLSSATPKRPSKDSGHASKQTSKLDGFRRSASSGSSSSLSYNCDDRSNAFDYARGIEPAYKFLHGKMGANFYLKCGMAAFCFGHVIHEGLRFGQQLYFFGTNNVPCRDLAALVAHIITPLFSFYQLFMMFKYSNLVINRHKILAKFGLMHIIGTSVTFWFRTIMEEAFEDFVHKMDYFKANKPDGLVTNRSSNDLNSNPLMTLMSSPISDTITPQMVRHLPDSYACAQNTLLTTKSMNALPYLYPFTIEYNLLLAATFLSLYINIGKVGHRGSGGSPRCRFSPNCSDSQIISNYFGASSKATSINGSTSVDCENSSSSATHRLGANKDPSAYEYKSNFVVNADCHSANKGLFCGFFVLLVALVTIVIFFVTINKPTHVQLGIKINLIQETTLTMLILVVTLAGLKQIVKLNVNPHLRERVTPDDVLMLIPLPFFFVHSLLSFRAEISTMSFECDGPIICLSSSKAANTLRSERDPFNLNIFATNDTNLNISKNPEIQLNNSFVGHQDVTAGRSIEDFISNSSSSNSGGNRNNYSNNNDSLTHPSRGNTLPRISGSLQVDHFKLITVALNIFVMIEVLVQTNFIIDGMRRCSESRYMRFKKPGRELITFAILLNITYWIVATFETKSVEQFKTEIEYYGPLPYMFISHTTLPVMLFYRYHSSVCLTEIWNRAYKPPKKPEGYNNG